MGAVIKGTTPTIIYKFNTVNVSDIATALLTIKAGGMIVVTRSLDTATVGENSLSWKLTQSETLLSTDTAQIMLNWVLGDGTRGATPETIVAFTPNHKEEVI